MRTAMLTASAPSEILADKALEVAEAMRRVHSKRTRLKALIAEIETTQRELDEASVEHCKLRRQLDAEIHSVAVSGAA